jgi:4-hydroxythreonine-4-phosphate dehydrogenase
MTAASKPRIAVAIGDPAGIGPEIALKAANDAAVRDLCVPVLVGDRGVLEFYADGLGLPFPDDTIDVGALDASGLTPGRSNADTGRAILAYASHAIAMAQKGEVDAVAACPQTQSSIKAAGIDFDGYPSFVARETGTDEDDVFMMLASDRLRIAHVTLHLGIRAALDLIDRPRIVRTLKAADAALKRIGIETPRLAVSGVNPHAGEGGLFGTEEIETVAPAIAEAVAAGIDAHGPFGADTMYLDAGYDAYVVMYHDQGHIPAKLVGFTGTAAFTIGTPVLFSSVAHGSALDIAGQGKADPGALTWTLRQIAGAA